LSEEQKEHLRGITFVDPLSFVHPRYFDRIKHIEHRKVERFYLNYAGEIHRSQLIILTEEEFWEPLKLVAEFYEKFGHLPAGTALSVPILKGSLSQKSKK
jgi:hypothetical protein